MATKDKNTLRDPTDIRLSPMLALSFFAHLAVFSLFLFVPDSNSVRPVEGVIYEVNLVEMPAGMDIKPRKTTTAAGKKTGKPIFKKKTRARRIKALEKKKKKSLVVAKRTVTKKTSPRKKPRKSRSQLIDRAISRIAKKVKRSPEGRNDHIDKAISKIEGRVSRRQVGGLRGGQPVSGIPMRMYQIEVENWVKSNWSYPVALNSSKARSTLESIVLLMVKRDGTIVKIQVKKRSSNAIFDQSVTKAIKKSDPLPPFPEGYRKSYEEFEIKFNLRELEG